MVLANKGSPSYNGRKVIVCCMCKHDGMMGELSTRVSYVVFALSSKLYKKRWLIVISQKLKLCRIDNVLAPHFPWEQFLM